MKIGYDYYKTVDKDVRALFAKYFKDRKAVNRRAKRFAKKYGADTRRFINSGSNSNYGVLGFMFPKGVTVPEDWTMTDSSFRCYRPYKKSKAYADFEKIGRVSTQEIEDKIKWKLLFAGGFVYFFSFGYNEKKNIAVIAVPKFDIEDYEEHPDLKYRPPRGMLKKITYKEYRKLIPPDRD